MIGAIKRNTAIGVEIADGSVAKSCDVLLHELVDGGLELDVLGHHPALDWLIEHGQNLQRGPFGTLIRTGLVTAACQCTHGSLGIGDPLHSGCSSTCSTRDIHVVPPLVLRGAKACRKESSPTNTRCATASFLSSQSLGPSWPVLTGSIIVETIFSWPGFGYTLITAVQYRDYPLVQFGVLIVAAIVIMVNLIVDIVYGVIDPRIRTEA